jgi:hypothetical protein
VIDANVKDETGSDMLYELSAPDVVSDMLGDEVVIINLDTGMYFRAVGPAAHVWQALIEGASPGSVPADQRLELDSYVSLLAGHDLIRRRQTDGTHDPYPAWSPGALTLETHDDLKDLLALDPVHDVNTASGWPEQPTT